MANRIEIYEQTDEGEVTHASGLNYGLVWEEMWHTDGGTTTYPWLYKIDGNGTTLFDDGILPEFIKEIEKLKLGVKSQAIINEIDNIVHFVSNKQVGTVIRFTAE